MEFEGALLAVERPGHPDVCTCRLRDPIQDCPCSRVRPAPSTGSRPLNPGQARTVACVGEQA
jgi:hypothetical protein